MQLAYSENAREKGTDQMTALKQDIASLIPRVDAGGRKARAALIRLISLSAKQPSAKLMKSATSSVELQRLAGSVLTLISGMPVTSELSDDKSGSDGVVNIVMPRPSRVYAPDKAMIELASGIGLK